jgi:hypothetical protein
MEEHFLDKLVRQGDPSARKGSEEQNPELWYNPHGDCIEFQTINDEVIAERIDNFLTIYRSATNREPIGFQLKDVQRLVQKFECTGIEVNATVKGQRLIRVTGLLLWAYESEPVNITRRSGYTSALSAIAPRTAQVAVPMVTAH